MAKAAAKISIALEAQTASLKQGFAEAKGAINSLDSNMAGSVAKGMAMFTAGLGAIKAALAMVQKGLSLVSGALAQLDQQQKVADKIGMTADSLAALNHAAVLAGESAEIVNDAMMRMTKSVSEAAERGTGPASKALEELGLNARRLNELDTEQKLGAIADAMLGVSNTNDKMRIAMELFGRQGHVFVNMLGEGSAGLDAMAKRAEELGLTLGEQRRLVEEANDAVADMKAAWNSFVQLLAVTVAPVIKWVADAITSLGIAVRKLFGWGGDEIAKKFSGGLEEAKMRADDITDEMRKSMEDAAKAAEKEAEAFASRGAAIAKGLREPAEIFADAMEELNELVRAGAISWTIYQRGVKKAFEEVSKGKDAADWSTPGIGALTRGSAGAFSATQQNMRDKVDADRRHAEHMARLDRMDRSIREHSIVLAPVHL